MTSPLTFMHLSDIHFTKTSGGVLDLDLELRSQLENDAKRMKKQLGNIQGILITGDIAYSGQQNEYDTALSWLRTLAKLIGCEKQNVWVTPGNHDVDRNVIDESKPLKDQHKRFRETPPRLIDKEIEATFNDKTYSTLVFEPIKSYIKFASKFSCEIDVKKPTWTDDISLNDGTILKLNGLNSTLTSDKFDNDKENKLLLGAHQTMMIETPDIIHMTLCHHPPDWLFDKDNVNKALLSKVKIQLFGHKHSQDILKLTNGEGNETLQIVSGAVHPERREIDWGPCYNYLSFSIENKNEDRFLKVIVNQRVWDQDNYSFQLPISSKEYRLKLPTIVKTLPKHTKNTKNKIIEKKETNPTQVGEGKMDSKKELAYKFLTLPYHQMLKISLKLGLLEDTDENLMDFEIFKKILSRAESNGTTKELWAAVYKKYDENCNHY